MLSAARDTLFFITTHSSGNDKSLLELQSANLTRMCEMKKRSSKYSYIIIDLFLDDLLGMIALVLHWMRMMPSLLYKQINHWFCELVIKFISCMLAGSQLVHVYLNVCM